jgi:hypothetical protein
VGGTRYNAAMRLKPLLFAAFLMVQLVACTETPEHKAAVEEMDRRHAWMIETMSGTGGR